MSGTKFRFRAFSLFVAALVWADIGSASIEETSTTFAAPGTLVWVGNHRLHLNCIGTGSPTVVFDSGLGGSSLDWTRVHREVASFTRACTYDRAGYGWSDPGPLPRDSRRISRELATLLGNASVPAPYLLVGHSFGGFNVRLFSNENPQRVAGLILLDSSHEDQFQRFEQAGIGSSAPRHGSFILHNAIQVPAALPSDAAPIANAFANRRRSMVTVRSELAQFRRSAAQVRRAADLPNVPLIVISHRIDGVVAPSDADEERAKIWMEMQVELANRTLLGKHVIAATDDHYVHLSQPRLVVEAIRDVVFRSY